VVVAQPVDDGGIDVHRPNVRRDQRLQRVHRVRRRRRRRIVVSASGSADPTGDGSVPTGNVVKANADSMLYHTPESPYFGRT
jgi:hypothetical protein